MSDAPTFTRDDARTRYEMEVGDEVAGFALFRPRPNGVLAFVHTEVDDRFAGQGLASKLIRFALDDVRERGERVLPYCPFVRRFLAEHPEDRDLVPRDRRAEFDLS